MSTSARHETTTAWLSRELVRYAPSLEKEMLALPALVRPGDVCFDIGASFGTYTVALARLVRPGGRVHAVEPRPRSLCVLALVSRLLTAGNVEVHPIALSDRTDREVIVTPRRRWLLPVPGRTFLKGSLEAGPEGYYPGWYEEFGGAAERVVVTLTCDGLAHDNDIDRVDFIKIDVEGAELRVLVGAEATLLRHRPIVLCEIEDRHTRKYGHSARDVFDWLELRGYHPHVFDGRGLRVVDGLQAGENNYVFLPEDRDEGGGTGPETGGGCRVARGEGPQARAGGEIGEGPQARAGGEMPDDQTGGLIEAFGASEQEDRG